jgi:hypothetical protein
MRKAVLFSMLMVWVFFGRITADSNSETTGLAASPVQELAKSSELMFSGCEDHDIEMDAAERMMSDFQANNPYKAYGWYLGRMAIEDLLGQPGAVGIRIYGGLDAEGEFSPVIFGVDSLGNDLPLRGLQKQIQGSHGELPKEKLPPCPPYCP